MRVEVFLAQSGDTVDASQLQCSVITLGSVINVSQNNLYLLGPGADSLTIDGAAHSRVFNHSGSGTFAVNRLKVANGNGYLGGYNTSRGGCIGSIGNVSLSNSVISHCTVETADSTPARGGAIYVAGNLSMANSTIVGSHAYAAADSATGGGAWVQGNFTATYSSINGNVAYDNNDAQSKAGGAFILGDAVIYGSTISENRSEASGGLAISGGPVHTAQIVNSTISTNRSEVGSGGIWTNSPLTLIASTIAFNRQDQSESGAGLYSSNADLKVMSSIVADNVGTMGASDVGASAGVQLTATSSLIVQTSLSVGSGTIRTCPRLQPLSDNGGGTLTHAVSESSPAIDTGVNFLSLTNDQRFATRDVGVYEDIGSVERQVGEIDDRRFVDGFDGLCDQ